MILTPVSYYVDKDTRIENRDPEGRFPDRASWAVTRHSSTLNTDFMWELEPLPSGRTDDYFARNRFSFLGAKAHYEEYLRKKKEKQNG